MKLKTKFILFGITSIIIVVSQGLAQKLSLLELDRISKTQQWATQMGQRHMEGDMMHDAVHDDVLAAMVAVATNDKAVLDEEKKSFHHDYEDFAKRVAENMQSDLPADIHAKLESVASSVKAYEDTGQAVLDSTDDFAAASAKLPAFNAMYESLEKSQGVVSDAILSWSAELDVSGKALRNEIEIISLILAAVSACMSVWITTFAIRGIFRPQSNMSCAMHSIADGNTDTIIPYTQRNDEMGDLARTVQVFKDNALKIVKMNEEQEAQKVEAEKQKRAAMHQMADGFEIKVKGIVSTVASAATELAQTAEGLVRTMNETSQTVQNAVSGAAQTSANVQSVASAAEEMTASVKEISGQLQNSNMMVQDSVKKAESADSQAIHLSTATTKVKEVISLIANIAGQINLLALNATIESARAGEAGKGFAVVASEVKNLASQTDKSVQEIEKVIQEMNLASDEIIGSLKSIKESIQNISGASGTIAAAVEEQSATTNEIARNMQSAAQGTQTISGNLNDVSSSAAHAETSSGQVLEASKELSRQAEQLNKEVKEFLHTVRTA